MSARARKFFRRYLFAVQRVGDLHADRGFLVGIALVIDIFAVRLPGDLVAILGVGLIALDILNIGKVRDVLNAARLVQVLQPVGDKHGLLIAIRIRKDVDRLFLPRRSAGIRIFLS